ncbi:MAG: zinc-ribbon domain-containing protein [Myxococcota bacterium]|nr:zinc-ribbon domain-containing protein [Myxococcota bacterium]
MDVTCKKCSAAYSLEDALVASDGTSVRCTKCGDVFTVYPPGGAKRAKDRWQVHRATGGTIVFDRIAALQQAISTGIISKNDVLSRDGGLSKRIGDIPEMVPFFSKSAPPVPEPDLSTLSTQEMSAPSLFDKLPVEPSSQPDPKSIPGSQDEPDFSQIPASADEKEWDRGSNIDVSGPEWAEKTGKIPRYRKDFASLPPVKRKMGRWVPLLVVVFLVISIGYFIKFQYENVDDVVGDMLSTSSDSRHKKFYDRGRESFLLDSFAHFRQAEREFQKVLGLEENHAATLSALAEMYAVWAQYLRDAEVDALIDVTGEKTPGAATTRESQRLVSEYQEKLRDAADWADQAIKADPDLPEANRAMADIKRLQGNLVLARSHLGKALAKQGDPEAAYVAVLIDRDSGEAVDKLAFRLSQLTGNRPLIRAMYRNARMLASKGNNNAAREVLAKLFELNPDHLMARDLAARIDDGKKVVLSVDTGRKAGLHPPLPTAVSNIDEKEPVPDKQTPVSEPTTSAPTPSKNTAPRQPAGIGEMLARASRLKKKGRNAEATRLYASVVERSPNNLDALTGLADCYKNAGATGKAMTYFRRVLQRSPSHGPALIGLAKTFKMRGQKEQALKYYNQYIQTNPNGSQINMAKQNVSLLELAVRLDNEEPEADPSPEKAPDEAESPPLEEERVVVLPPDDQQAPEDEGSAADEATEDAVPDDQPAPSEE